MGKTNYVERKTFRYLRNAPPSHYFVGFSLNSGAASAAQNLQTQSAVKCIASIQPTCFRPYIHCSYLVTLPTPACANLHQFGKHPQPARFIHSPISAALLQFKEIFMLSGPAAAAYLSPLSCR